MSVSIFSALDKGTQTKLAALSAESKARKINADPRALARMGNGIVLVVTGTGGQFTTSVNQRIPADHWRRMCKATAGQSGWSWYRDESGRMICVHESQKAGVLERIPAK